MALSVMSFCCVILLGLLTDGLSTLHQATANTVQAEIVQAIVNNSQINYFTNSASYYNTTTNFYFDDEGVAVTANDPRQVYTASVTGAKVVVPSSTGSFSMLTNDCMQLQISIVGKSSGGAAHYNVVWPNTGN